MRSRFKILGHPAHPSLIVITLGLYPAAAIADIVFLIFGAEFLWPMAFWLLVGGFIAQNVAALPGFIDWLNIPADAPAKRPATFHLVIAMLIAFLAFVSLLLRDPFNLAANAPHIRLPDDMYFLVAIGVNIFNALVLLTFQGWLGAELVYKHGIGVERSDHIDPVATTPGAERLGEARDAT